MVKDIYSLFLRFWSSNTRIKYATMVGVQVGNNCRFYSTNFGSEPYLISIGNHVTISGGVQFVTHDGGVWLFRDKNPQVDFIRPIIIYDNCFIGLNSIIMPGVVIGPNSVIGAGSVVTKSVPPDTVVAGVPARYICTLQDYEMKLDICLLTSKMNYQQKKKYLLDYYGQTSTEWISKLDEYK